jgi:hypothetical protein
MTVTWGPSARSSRLLYTAVVRPTLLYGSQEWSMRGDGKPLAATTTAPLHEVQNKCLRRITGAYRRTPRVALERETHVMPINLHMEVSRYQQANRIKEYQVEVQIARAANTVWSRMRRARTVHARPVTGRETSRSQVTERV